MIHWPTATLGDLTSRTRPICYGVLKPGPHVPGGVPLLRIVDIKANSVDPSEVHLISQELDAEFARSRLLGGEVLLSIQGTIGRVAICPQELAGANISRTIAVIDPDARIDKGFLRFYLLYLASAQRFEVTGTTRDSLNISTIRELEVPLPPLDEQQRIVAILEDHLSRLEVAKDGLRSAEIWSEALQRRAIVSLLAVDGVECELSELLEFSIGGLWGEDPGSSDLDVKVLRVTELGRWGVLDPATAALRSISGKQYESRSLHQGDLLLEKSGGGPTTPVGRVGIVTELDEPSVCSNFMQLMRPDRAKVSPRWLHLYLNACHLAGQTNGMQKASTNIRNIKASEYLRMRVKVPELSQQEVLISECEAWLLRGGRLQASVSKSEREAAGLRLSLLQAAFTGQLTRGAISV